MKDVIRSEGNLATQNVEDFTVLANGDAYISQRMTAKLCGVDLKAVQKHIASRHPNEVISKGISSKLLQQVVTYYSIESKAANDVARETLAKLAEAGAKAFIYHHAGYNMQAVPRTFAEALQLAANQQRLIEEQQKQIEFDRPKVEFHDLVISENPIISMNEFAKELTKQYGVKIGQNKMMAFLREKKILMNGRDRTERNKPYQKYMNLGWFECEYVTTPIGLAVQSFITGEGQVKLSRLIVEHFKSI